MVFNPGLIILSLTPWLLCELMELPRVPVGPRPYGTCTGDDGLEATAARQPDGQVQRGVR